MLKSYAPDFTYAQRLVTSFNAHNPEGLQLYCVVPVEDMTLFSTLQGPHVTVMDETPFAAHLVNEPVADLRPGYINQEIIKFAFHELGLADNYFCIDSEAVIIRDLQEADFIAPDGVPYTVMVEDNELKVEPQYYQQYWTSRETSVRVIADALGMDDPVLRTCHGHQVFSSAVMRDFVVRVLKPRNWDYRDALALAPYEFSWYTLWTQVCGVIPVHSREPLVKVFHHEGQHFEYILRGITEADIARGFLAVVVNSSYSREIGPIPVGTPKPQALAPYLSYGEAAKLLQAKLGDTWRRRTGRS